MRQEMTCPSCRQRFMPAACAAPGCPHCHAIVARPGARRYAVLPGTGLVPRTAPSGCPYCGGPVEALYSFCPHCRGFLDAGPGAGRVERPPRGAAAAGLAVLLGVGLCLGLVGLGAHLGGLAKFPPIFAALTLVVFLVLVVGGLGAVVLRYWPDWETGDSAAPAGEAGREPGAPAGGT